MNGTVERPILYAMMWLAGLQVVVLSRRSPAGLADADISVYVYVLWSILTLLGPVLVTAAWAMTRWGSGRARVAAMWLRLGGDISILAGLTVFMLTIRALVAQLDKPLGDASAFAFITLTGVALIVAVWIGRDVNDIARMNATAADMAR